MTQQDSRHGLLIEALVSGKGFTRERAESFLLDYEVDLQDKGRAEYEEVLERLIGAEADDPNDWDGDDSAVNIYLRFLEALPDMIRHRVAGQVRAALPDIPARFRAVRRTVVHLAGQIDPFELRRITPQPYEYEQTWVYKSTGEPVPWPVVKD